MFIGEYEYIVLKLKRFNRKIYLPYVKRIYKSLRRQESSFLYRLRKIGKKIRMRNGKYQLLIQSKKISQNSKDRIIEKVLDMKDNNGKSLQEIINWKFEADSNKKKDDIYNGDYEFILDVLGTFYMADGKDLSILTDRQLRRIKKYEVCTYRDEIYHAKKTWFELAKVGKDDIAAFEDKNRMQTKRWKKSKTYKLNKILKEMGNYEAKWCYVNSENKFTFNNKLYRISDDIEQYKIEENELIMDNILVIKNEKGLSFFDMNIDEISLKYIERK